MRDTGYSEVPLFGDDDVVRAWATVDDADYGWAMSFRWWKLSSGYAVRGGPQRRVYLMHRELLGLPHGDPRQSDHINRDRLDNRRSNLRIVTAAENSQNNGGRPNRSGYRGVYLHASGKWQVIVVVRRRRYHLGSFTSPELADRVAKAFRAKHVPLSPDI